MKAAVVRAIAAGVLGVAVVASAQQPNAPAFASPNLSPGGVRALAATCAPCHGTQGKAAPGSTVPGLAGRPKAEIATAMAQFRSGERASTVMGQLAKGLGEAEVDAIAGYFAAGSP